MFFKKFIVDILWIVCEEVISCLCGVGKQHQINHSDGEKCIRRPPPTQLFTSLSCYPNLGNKTIFLNKIAPCSLPDTLKTFVYLPHTVPYFLSAYNAVETGPASRVTVRKKADIDSSPSRALTQWVWWSFIEHLLHVCPSAGHST